MNKNEVRTAWSKAVNDKNNWSYKDPMYGNKINGKLQAKHYLAYNVIRGLPLIRGFSHGDTFDNLVASFANLLDRATNASGMNQSYGLKYLTEYTDFFGEDLSMDDFLEKANEALRLYSCS